ncbi:aldehyde dehydrogenase family protein, partial [Rhizobium ruizarguesonis]
ALFERPFLPGLLRLAGARHHVLGGVEINGFNERSNYVASIAADALAPVIVEERESFERRIEREAHGVVFVVAPWNYPYMTAINTIAPALMAG